MKCIKCGADIPEESVFCLKCGEKVQNVEAYENVQNIGGEYCPLCGVQNAVDSEFCFRCGNRLKRRKKQMLQRYLH